MTREQLEHLIRVCAEITDQYEFVIVGSQSILGQVPNPPAVFTVSMEADMYPLAAPELAEKIEGAIGEGSHFQTTHGYYASGVGPDTATLPEDWMTRAHRIQNSNTDLKVGWCLDMKDLFLAKAVAGRLPKDRAFCMALLEHGYVASSGPYRSWSLCRSTTMERSVCERPFDVGRRRCASPAQTLRADYQASDDFAQLARSDGVERETFARLRSRLIGPTCGAGAQARECRPCVRCSALAGAEQCAKRCWSWLHCGAYFARAYAVPSSAAATSQRSVTPGRGRVWRLQDFRFAAVADLARRAGRDRSWGSRGESSVREPSAPTSAC